MRKSAGQLGTHLTCSVGTLLGCDIAHGATDSGKSVVSNLTTNRSQTYT